MQHNQRLNLANQVKPTTIERTTLPLGQMRSALLEVHHKKYVRVKNISNGSLREAAQTNFFRKGNETALSNFVSDLVERALITVEGKSDLGFNNHERKEILAARQELGRIKDSAIKERKTRILKLKLANQIHKITNQKISIDDALDVIEAHSQHIIPAKIIKDAFVNNGAMGVSVIGDIYHLDLTADKHGKPQLIYTCDELSCYKMGGLVHTIPVHLKAKMSVSMRDHAFGYQLDELQTSRPEIIQPIFTGLTDYKQFLNLAHLKDKSPTDGDLFLARLKETEKAIVEFQEVTIKKEFTSFIEAYKLVVEKKPQNVPINTYESILVNIKEFLETDADTPEKIDALHEILNNIQKDCSRLCPELSAKADIIRQTLPDKNTVKNKVALGDLIYTEDQTTNICFDDAVTLAKLQGCYRVSPVRQDYIKDIELLKNSFHKETLTRELEFLATNPDDKTIQRRHDEFVQYVAARQDLDTAKASNVDGKKEEHTQMAACFDGMVSRNDVLVHLPTATSMVSSYSDYVNKPNGPVKDKKLGEFGNHLKAFGDKHGIDSHLVTAAAVLFTTLVFASAVALAVSTGGIAIPFIAIASTPLISALGATAAMAATTALAAVSAVSTAAIVKFGFFRKNDAVNTQKKAAKEVKDQADPIMVQLRSPAPKA